jgi:hypothetical protein
VVLAKGKEFGEEGANRLPGNTERPAAPVNGRPAFCLVHPTAPGSCDALVWEYAPGAWARVLYDGALTNPAASAALVRRVAESVSLSAAEPVRLPFRLTGKTARLRPVRVLTSQSVDGRQPWSVNVLLSDRPREWRTLGDEAVTLDVDQLPASGGRLPHDPAPNTTIDGHPARIEGKPLPDVLFVWGVRGTHVFVNTQREGLDPRTVYRDTQLVSNPNDLASWVEHPFG